jgi:hypothetical protein
MRGNHPQETRHPAAFQGANAPLLLATNNKLDAAIVAGFGKDDEWDMPEAAGVDWAIDRIEPWLAIVPA